MPAAAVIPAPIAYIKVVAVKKLVVGYLVGAMGLALARVLQLTPAILGESPSGIRLSGGGSPSFTVKKLECSKQAYAAEYISME